MFRSRAHLILAIAYFAAMFSSSSRADDWPCWRGPEGNNHASDRTDAPIRWDLENGANVVWKTPLPGRGHSSPVIIQDSIFLTTADSNRKTQSLLKLDRDSGRLVDQWILHRDTLPAEIHPNNSHASPTPAWNGENLFVVFHTADAIWMTAMTTSGREVWQKRVCEFRPSAFRFGYGASPIVEDDLIIVAAEYDGPESGIYAFGKFLGRAI
jgi:outer membrane protein assembly factor BamB